MNNVAASALVLFFRSVNLTIIWSDEYWAKNAALHKENPIAIITSPTAVLIRADPGAQKGICNIPKIRWWTEYSNPKAGCTEAIGLRGSDKNVHRKGAPPMSVYYNVPTRMPLIYFGLRPFRRSINEDYFRKYFLALLRAPSRYELAIISFREVAVSWRFRDASQRITGEKAGSFLE